MSHKDLRESHIAARPRAGCWTAAPPIGAVLLLSAGADAQSCPERLRGGRQSELPARDLFEVGLVISVNDDGRFSSQLRRWSGTVESPVVWRDGRHLSLQSNDRSLTLDARIAADGAQIGGFIAYASNLYRVSLPADGQDTWRALWSLRPGRPDTLAIDLYFDDVGAGSSAGYFFFRDQCLPGRRTASRRATGLRRLPTAPPKGPATAGTRQGPPPWGSMCTCSRKCSRRSRVTNFR